MEHTEEPPPTTPLLMRRTLAIELTGLPESTFDRWVSNGTIARPSVPTPPGSWFERTEIERVKGLIG